MKEFDVGAYQRKWQASIGIAQYGENKIAVRYDQIEPYNCGEGTFIYVRCAPLAEAWLHRKPSNADGHVIEPLYYPFETGVYTAKNGFIVLTRNHRKSYTCGITMNSFHIHTGGLTGSYDWQAIHWLGGIVPRDYDGKEMGYISRKVWWHGDRLFYLHTLIGLINKSRVKVNNSLYIPYLRSVFRKCQIEVL